MEGASHKGAPYRREGDAIRIGIDASHVVEQVGPGDEAVARIGTAQHGAIDVPQLRVCGLDSGAIRRRAARGWLRAKHRGVYLIGHEAPNDWTEAIAAALAVGADTACWGQTASWLHGLMPNLGKPLQLASLGTHRRSRPGIELHRPVDLRRSDLTVVERIPTVKPAVALLGLAAATDAETTRRALNEARALRLPIDRWLRELGVRRRQRGWGTLSVLLNSERGPDFTRSEAEAKLGRLLQASGLPRPLRNRRIAGYEVDFLWPDHGVVVEVDGFAFHSSPEAFERDRAKWADLEARGLSVTPFTWKQIVRRREWIVAHVASRLASRGTGSIRAGPPR